MNRRIENFQTFTGRLVNPLGLGVDDIMIEDVAHSLANMCRWTGHVSRPYSVAEHSLHVASLLASWSAGTSTVLRGLAHDGSEAYLVDLPKPLKELPEFAWYGAAEARAQRVVYLAMGLNPDAAEAEQLVHVADVVMRAIEARDLMGGHLAELYRRDIPEDCTVSLLGHPGYEVKRTFRDQLTHYRDRVAGMLPAYDPAPSIARVSAELKGEARAG